MKKSYGIALALTCGLVPTIKAQNLDIANAESGTIGEYGLDGSTVNAALISGLDGPSDILISGNDMFVVNQSGGTIGEYTLSGQTINADLISELVRPWGIAISGNDLFVVNAPSTDTGYIGEYTTSGATVNADLISGLDDPEGIAIVPEPSTGALAGFGAVALWLWCRRK